MELSCIEVEPGRICVEPAEHKRRWMTETPNGFAYRCVPLAVANAHGWNMLCPVSFSATWNGGSGVDAIAIEAEVPTAPWPHEIVESHFGSGVLTFNPLLILRTEPGYDLWVSGPPNEGKDGIAPLSAVVETDWSPHTFTMNWRFTRPNHTVRFEAGEPFCFFFPIKRGLGEESRPRLATLEQEPELSKQYFAARAHRNTARLAPRDARDLFQAWYARAEMPKGGEAPVTGHKVKSKPEPFTR